MCVYIYIYVCVYIYIYIYIGPPIQVAFPDPTLRMPLFRGRWSPLLATIILIVIYIYICIHRERERESEREREIDIPFDPPPTRRGPCRTGRTRAERRTGRTPSPPTKSFNFRGFDSSRLLILRVGNSHVRRI